jgi:hypothetical protein
MKDVFYFLTIFPTVFTLERRDRKMNRSQDFEIHLFEGKKKDKM